MATDMGSILKVGLVGAAGFLAYRYFFAAPAPGGDGAGSGDGAGAGAGGGTTDYNSIASLFSRLSTRAAKDGVTLASPDQWCAIYHAEGGPACPDPIELFGNRDPMTLAAFWAKLSAWLASEKGLKGLGVYQGLFHLAMGGRLK